MIVSVFAASSLRAESTVKPEEKIPLDWRLGDIPHFPLRIIVEYQDEKQKAKEQNLNQNIRLNKKARRFYQQQLASMFATLKTKVLKAKQIPDKQIHKDYSHLPMNALVINSVEELQDLLNDARIKSVNPDIVLYPNLLQSRGLVSADKAYINLGANGSGSSVVVLDTGVDYTHADFGACIAPGSPASCRVIVSGDLAIDDGQLDDNGHGTNVSSIVASVASASNLIVFDVFDGAGAYSSDIIDGINWAIVNQAAYNIAAINMSLGGSTKFTSPCNSDNPFSNPYKTPVAAAKTVGILTVVSSGNDGYTDGITMPACLPDVLSVGAVYDSNIGSISWNTSPICTDATTSADKITCFSNSASFLKLLAPGALITAAGLTMGGTSQAAPHVAAIAAILNSAYPDESVEALETRIIGSGDIVTDHRNSLVFPRVNAWSALGAINDDFDSPLNLSPTTSQLSINTWNANKEVGEPDHAGESGGKSIWFIFTALEDGLLEIDTQGSSFDTVLAVYSGTTVSGLSSIASNNDDVGITGGYSKVITPISAGTTFHIAADGVSGSGGELVINVSFEAGPITQISREIRMVPNWAEVIMGLALVIISLIKNNSPRIPKVYR